MRRIALLTALLSLGLSATAAAWVEMPPYAIPGGGIADCLRTAGPGRLMLVGKHDAADLLSAGPGGISRTSSTTLGLLGACPEAGSTTGAAPLLVGVVLTGGARSVEQALRIADAGGTPASLRQMSRTAVIGPAVATAPSGAAIVAWIEVHAPIGGSTQPSATLLAATRPAAGAPFAPPRRVPSPPVDGSSSDTILRYLRVGGQPPADQHGGDVTAALSRNGDVVVTWTDLAGHGSAAAARAARGTLAAGLARAQRLGGPCRSASAARPLSLADGTLGVAWTDEARSATFVDEDIPLGGGLLHVALPGAPPPRPAVPGPTLAARVAGRGGGALRVRVRCGRGPCDVRASATAYGSVQAPAKLHLHFAAERLPVATAATFPASREAVLRLVAERGFAVGAGPRRADRTVTVIACTPDGPIAARRTLRLPPR